MPRLAQTCFSLCLLALAATPAHARKVTASGYATAGVGYPELARTEAGLFINRRTSVELILGLPTPELVTEFPTLPDFDELNLMFGASITGWLVGFCNGMRPPENSLIVSGGLRINIFAPFSLEADGVQLGPTAEIMAGYARMTKDLVLFKVQAGFMMYADDGFGIGPNIVATVGKAFP